MVLFKNVKSLAQVAVVIHIVLAVVTMVGPALLMVMGTVASESAFAALSIIPALLLGVAGCAFWLVTAVPWMILYTCTEIVDAVDRAHRGIAKSVNRGNENMTAYYNAIADGMNATHAKLSEGVDRGYDIVDRLESAHV